MGTRQWPRKLQTAMPEVVDDTADVRAGDPVMRKEWNRYQGSHKDRWKPN
ncbi:hypothetical protein ACFFS4_17090 [Kutzneria kofuensis]|uniref:Uncharacterized protein n=1 Tax=Kutzneria kofuensis TaxID=103725 RepID=A0A7W9KHB6_9PSEU|nr:hypothetical protein [Kutzneria kofuensis]MBB5892452.1 hypothetical protein [Kutzneria kofuensis]